MKMIHTPYSRQQAGHYSPGVLSQDTLYISGQLPRNPETQVIPEGMEAQTHQVLQNLNMVLEAAGLSRTSVVSVRIYLTHVQHWDVVNALYSQFFGEHKPARAVITVPELHYGCLIELEAVAEQGE